MNRPLLAVLAFCLFVAGCGQEQKSDVDISMTTVVWQGYINEDPQMLKYFDETTSCLETYGYSYNGYPYVFITAGEFNCGGEIGTAGCANSSTNKIYIQVDWSCHSVLDSSCPTDVLKEEIIHWETGKGNEYLSEPFFHNCKFPVPL